MPDFKDFLNALKGQLAGLAVGELKAYAAQLRADADAFLKDTEADLKRWTNDLANGAMSQQGFALAVRGRATVARMVALKQAGLAAIAVDKARQSILDAVIGTAAKIFLPR